MTTIAKEINNKLDAILNIRSEIKKMRAELSADSELVNPNTGDKLLRDDAIKIAEEVINKVQNDINQITNNGQNVRNIFNNQYYINDMLQDKQIANENSSNIKAFIQESEDKIK